MTSYLPWSKFARSLTRPKSGFTTTQRNCHSSGRSAVCSGSARTDCSAISSRGNLLSKRVDIYMAYAVGSPLKGDNGDEKNNNLLGGEDHPPAQAQRAGRGSVNGGADTPGCRRVHEAPPARGEKGGAAMRGDGSIYSRGNVLWIAYSFRGQMFRESAHTNDEKVARKLLKHRLKQVERPGFVGPKEDKWTLADMNARIEADYQRKQNRSLKTVEYCFKHLEKAFPFRRVIDITTPTVQEYTQKRLQAR